jgi:diguanylate cyclase (GGDEF)-like protein
MDSFLRYIQESQSVENWQLFRLSAHELTHLLSALRQQPCTLSEIKLTSRPGSHLLLFKDHETVLVVTEPSTASPSPFRCYQNPNSVAYTTDIKTISMFLSAWSAPGDVADILHTSQANQKDVSPLLILLDGARHQANLELECQTHQALQIENALEQDGETLFEFFGGKVRKLLNPDYIEIQAENPSDYWTGRSNGWVWRHSPYSGQLLSVILSPRSTPLIYRRETPFFVEDPTSSKEIMNGALVSLMNFKSGFLLPLSFQGNRLGILKLFYTENLVPIERDYQALEQFRLGMALLLYHTRLHLRAQRLATIDGLTNLFNHWFFRDQLRKEFQRARRYRKKMSLIMIDIDDFKLFNDTYGHLAGDKALSEVAATIRKSVRDIDFVARYGGEEFALILPEINAKNGLIVAEKIRKAVEARTYATDETQSKGTMTISCGVTDNSDAKGPDDLIERADRALYWVKKHGRNLVRVETMGQEE